VVAVVVLVAQTELLAEQQQGVPVEIMVAAVVVVAVLLLPLEQAGLAEVPLCVLFGPVTLVHSLQQIQVIYKWNFIFVLLMVNRLSIQFLVIIFVKHFLT
jgi:hypothetical protein